MIVIIKNLAYPWWSLPRHDDAIQICSAGSKQSNVNRLKKEGDEHLGAAPGSGQLSRFFKLLLLPGQVVGR